MKYEVQTRFLGKRVIVFQCSHCNDDLVAPFEDAGVEQPCPKCGRSFVTPGKEKLVAEREAVRKLEEEVRRKEEERRQEKERQRHQASLKEEERRRQEEIRKLNAPRPAPPPEPVMVWYGAMYCNACGYNWQARRQTPPARCPSCSKRNITTVKEPQRSMQGCLLIIVLFTVLLMLPPVLGRLV